MLAPYLALAVAASPKPTTAASTASCPTERTRVVHESSIVVPAGAHPTHGRIRYLVDVGSDGRVRRSVLVESSGDSALDAAAATALSEYRYAAPSYACTAISTVATQYWDLPPDALAAPETPLGASPMPVPCTAQLVRAVMLQTPRYRKTPGTVGVDVSLDAGARVTGVHLAQSSGNAKTDYAGTAAARTGRFMFAPQPGCPPAPALYRLELTFR